MIGGIGKAKPSCSVVFATNQSLPSSARVVYGPSSRVPPLFTLPQRKQALGYLSIH
jgi:hypothetical protein